MFSARSPIIAHTTASLEGLTTIHACGAENQLKREFEDALDANTSAFFLFVATSRGFVSFCAFKALKSFEFFFLFRLFGWTSFA